MERGQEGQLPGSCSPQGQLQAIFLQFGGGTLLVCIRLLSLIAEGIQRKSGKQEGGLPPTGTWLSLEPSLVVGAKVSFPP